MRTKDTQLSSDDIKDIVDLYKLGTSKLNIAKQFNRHHSTIIYHINRQEKIEGKQFIIKAKIPKRKVIVSEKRTHFVFKKQKTYEDYLEEDQARLLEKRAVCEHLEVIRTVRCKCCGHVETKVYSAV